MKYKSFKYRAYPTRRQKRIIGQQLFVLKVLGGFLRTFYANRDRTSVYDMINELPKLKKDLKCGELINAQVAQDYARRLYQELNTRFRQRKRAGAVTLQWPQYGLGVGIKDKGFYFDKIGLVKVKVHRPWQGEIKRVILKEITPPGLPKSLQSITRTGSTTSTYRPGEVNYKKLSKRRKYHVILVCAIV